MLEMFDFNANPINIDDYKPESISHRLVQQIQILPLHFLKLQVSLEDIRFPQLQQRPWLLMLKKELR
jgi:hypothetical protein